jgi:hypothetical protein
VNIRHVVWILILGTVCAQEGQPQQVKESERTQRRTGVAVDQLELRGVVAEATRFEGREAVRLLEANASRDGGIAVLKGVTFQDGTIELEVAGRRGPYAVPDDRGFIGVAFRIRPGGTPMNTST